MSNKSKYTMRKLKTSDIFALSKILKKMNLKFSAEPGQTQQQFGLEIIQRAFESIHMAEKEVSEFLSKLVGITPEEFNELPIEDTFEIINLFKEQEGISNFFKLASK